MKPDWERDGHRMYLGDCLDILPSLPAGSVDAVVTSPPYAMQRDYGGGSCDWDLLLDVLLCLPCASAECQLLINLGLVHRKGECIPYWEAWRERMRLAGWRFFGWYVWDQGDGLPGDWNGRLAPSHEFVLHFNMRARRPAKWMACKSVGRTITGTGLRRKDGTTPNQQSHSGRAIQPTKIADSVVRVYREMRRNIAHPAVYPVAFAAHLVQSFCPIDLTAIDPFMGSGTTGVACVRTGRRFIGIEKEEKYFAIAVDRMEKELARQPLLAGAS